MGAFTIGPALDLIDCNDNGVEDACDLDCGPPGGECDVFGCGTSIDCAPPNGVPDECEADCNNNGIADTCDIYDGTSTDCNENTVPDDCEPDCDGDGIPDDCDGSDADEDGIIDCDDRCPTTTPPDACVCPPTGQCCWSFICLPDWAPLDCLGSGGQPECSASPCHDGGLIGDSDGDGDLDLWDFGSFQNCFSDSNPSIVPTEDCLFAFDEDGDQDIDASDFKHYQANQTGP